MGGELKPGLFGHTVYRKSPSGEMIRRHGEAEKITEGWGTV
jgi:hypothetical protein